MIEIKSEDELLSEYNSLCREALLNSWTLNDLTNDELYIWIAGQTYSYGRNWEDSLTNAGCHLKDRGKTIKRFSVRKIDYLGIA